MASIPVWAIQIGVTVAVAAAQYLLRPKLPNTSQEGPRLPSLEAMGSTFGLPVPFARGTLRMSGNVVWAAPLVEVQHRESSGGGKGGGGGKNTLTTYSYFGNFAMSICEARPSQLMRVWADGKLIYDRVGEITNKYRDTSIRYYDGGADQLPDPLEQADKGVANTPAYRHLCRVVFEMLPLADFGNRLPQIACEVNFEDENFVYTETHDLVAPINDFSTSVYQRYTAPVGEIQWDKTRDCVFILTSNPLVLVRMDRKTMTVTATRDATFGEGVDSFEDGEMVPPGATRRSELVLDTETGDLIYEFSIGKIIYVRRIDGYSLSTKKDLFATNTNNEVFSWASGQVACLTQDKIMEEIIKGIGFSKFFIRISADGVIYSWALASTGDYYDMLLHTLEGGSLIGDSWVNVIANGLFGGFTTILEYMVSVRAGYQGQFGLDGINHRWPGFNSSGSSINSTPQIYEIVSDLDGNVWCVGSGNTTTASEGTGPLLIRLSRIQTRWVPTGIYRLRAIDGGITELEGDQQGEAYHLSYDRLTDSLLIHGKHNNQDDSPPQSYGFLARLSVPALMQAPLIYPETSDYHVNLENPFLVRDATLAVYVDRDKAYLSSTISSAIKFQFRVGPDFDIISVSRLSEQHEQEFSIFRFSDLTPVATYNLTDWLTNTAVSIGLQEKGVHFFSGRDHTVFMRCEFLAPDEAQDGWYRLDIDRLASSDTTLGDIVRAVAEKSGFADPEVDAAELNAIPIIGFILNQPSNGRAALEPFGQLFSFFPVEEDFKLKFKLKDRISVGTISQDSLGARAAGTTESFFISEGRLQESEIPRRFEVVHSDQERDYEEGVVTVQRTRFPLATQDSDEKLSLEMPAVVDPSLVKKNAESALYSAWTERETQNWQTDARHLEKSPGDVVDLELPNARTLSVRMVRSVVGPSYVMGVDSVTHDEEVFRSIAAASNNPGGIGFTAQTIDYTGITEVWPVDSNLLRDGDDPPAGNTGRIVSGPILVFFGPTRANWRGASLLKSTPRQNTFQVTRAGTAAPSWGIVSTSMPGIHPEAIKHTLLGPSDTIDDPYSLTINMQYGTEDMASVTDAEYYNETNVAFIGRPGAWELIMFRDFLDNGNGTVTISHIKRGHRGTEHIAHEGHRGGQIFIQVKIEDVMVERYLEDEVFSFFRFRADSIGSIDTEGTPRTMIVEANAFRPYSGTLFEAVVNGADIDVTWVRRSRIGNQDDLLDLITDVPLGELTEAYEIDIYDDTDTLVRAVTGLTTEAFTYTAAMMATDGTAQSQVITFLIYQISAAVNRGFGLTGVYPGTGLLVALVSTARIQFGSTQNLTVQEDTDQATISSSLELLANTSLFNKSLELFDTTEALFNSTQNDLGIANAWTIAGLALRNNVAMTNGDGAIFSAKETTGDENRIEIGWISGSAGARVRLWDSAGVSAKHYTYSLISDGNGDRWVRFVVTWDGTNLKLACNGKDVTPTVTTDLACTQTNTNRGIRSGTNFSSQHADIMLGSIAMWDEALTQAEREALSVDMEHHNLRANYGDYVSSANLVHYWRAGVAPTGSQSGQSYITDFLAGAGIDIAANAVDLSDADVFSEGPYNPAYQAHAIQFDGSSYILQNADTTQQLIGNWTIKFTVWSDRNDVNETIFQIKPGGSSASMIHVMKRGDLAGDALRIDCRNTSGTAYKDYSWNNAIPSGSWHTFTVVFNSTADTMKLYDVSGNELTPTTLHTDAVSSQSDASRRVCIGASIDGTNPFTGKIRQIATWSDDWTGATLADLVGHNVDLHRATANYLYDTTGVGTLEHWYLVGFPGSTAFRLTNAVDYMFDYSGSAVISQLNFSATVGITSADIVDEKP